VDRSTKAAENNIEQIGRQRLNAAGKTSRLTLFGRCHRLPKPLDAGSQQFNQCVITTILAKNPTAARTRRHERQHRDRGHGGAALTLISGLRDVQQRIGGPVARSARLLLKRRTNGTPTLGDCLGQHSRIQTPDFAVLKPMPGRGRYVARICVQDNQLHTKKTQKTKKTGVSAQGEKRERMIWRKKYENGIRKTSTKVKKPTPAIRLERASMGGTQTTRP